MFQTSHSTNKKKLENLYATDLAPWYLKYATTTCGENRHKICATKNCGEKLATCGEKYHKNSTTNFSKFKKRVFFSSIGI